MLFPELSRRMHAFSQLGDYLRFFNRSKVRLSVNDS